MTDEEREKTFVDLVKYSWQKYNETFYNQKIDDVLLGAVVANMVEDGFSLIDLNSDGVNHHLRFENLATRERLVFKLRHLSEDLTVAKVQGHLGDVTVGYGQRTDDIATVWSTFKSEMKSMFMQTAEPGIITFDADLTGGYIYAQIGLILDLDRYVARDLAVNLQLFDEHMEAVIHSLKKYLRGRLAVPAQA